MRRGKVRPTRRCPTCDKYTGASDRRFGKICALLDRAQGEERSAEPSSDWSAGGYVPGPRRVGAFVARRPARILVPAFVVFSSAVAA